MHKRHLKHINTLFVVLPMTLLMAFVGIARNYGFGDGWMYKMFQSWIIMMPVAYRGLHYHPSRKTAGRTGND